MAIETTGEQTDKRLGAFSAVDDTNAEDFIDRLDRIRALREFARYKQQTFTELRLEENHKIADIGCGAGDDAHALAGLVPKGRVTGIDHSSSMVREARRRFGDTVNLEFIESSAEALPFADASLDAIRVDRVLVHVEEPSVVVAEMLRALKPGGRITLSEPDMAACWVASETPDVSEVICRAVAQSCANPYIARAISIALRDLRLEEVEATNFGIIGHDYEVADRAVHFDSLVEAAREKGELTEASIMAWRTDLDLRREQNRFASGMSLISVSATKPT